MYKKKLEELTQENLQDFNVAPDLFLKRKKKKKTNQLFSSAIDHRSHKTEEQIIDYQKLVNKKYPERVYKKFLQKVLYTENIIVEEIENAKVGENLAKNPKKCFSNRDLTFIEDEVVIYDEDNSLDNISNKTLVETKKEDDSSLFINSKITYINNKDNSFSSFKSGNDFENKTDEQIKKIIEDKMKKMDEFNEKCSKRKYYELKKKYSLKKEHITKIIRFQKFFKSFLIKKNFFKAIYMNKVFEHKKNFLALKKSLKKFELFLKENPIYQQKLINNSIKMDYYFK